MTRRYIGKALRERIARQAGNRCGYCLTSQFISGMVMEIEHIVPVALGGDDAESNLWLACGDCNARKGERIAGPDPWTGLLAPFFNPRQHVWNEHFAWTSGGTHIIGLTPTGRATILALDLNRDPLTDARWLWAAAGWHPPQD